MLQWGKITPIALGSDQFNPVQFCGLVCDGGSDCYCLTVHELVILDLLQAEMYE